MKLKQLAAKVAPEVCKAGIAMGAGALANEGFDYLAGRTLHPVVFMTGIYVVTKIIERREEMNPLAVAGGFVRAIPGLLAAGVAQGQGADPITAGITGTAVAAILENGYQALKANVFPVAARKATKVGRSVKCKVKPVFEKIAEVGGKYFG